MRVLVNALSVNNLSGRHVLLGHLRMLAQWTVGQHDYVVLFHKSNQDMCRNLGSNVRWKECPGWTENWVGRAVWEIAAIERLAHREKADFLFTPSGTVVPGLKLPQVSFAQNPWALMKNMSHSSADAIKIRLQRRIYRKAVRQAAMMVYNSKHMESLYDRNADRKANVSTVVYQAIDDETHAKAELLRGETVRKPFQILSVSAMAPHKNIEALVKAISIVQTENSVPAHLVIAGAWPNPAYRSKIEVLVRQLGISDSVEILGHVSREKLDQLYAESRVFTLLSRCESFGIPALEAQVFGTPVVGSDCCAIPEVCGAGGVYYDPDDESGVARALMQLIENESYWQQLSGAALQNSARFRWERCSRGLLQMFDHV